MTAVLVAQEAAPAAPQDRVAAVEQQLSASEAAARRGALGEARAACRHALESADLEHASAEQLAALQKVLVKLGSHAERLGDLPTALAAHRAVLRHREATMEDTAINLQVARGNVANTLSAMGDLRGALALHQQVYDVFSATLADDAVNLQMARGALAGTLEALGDLDAALPLQEKVLAVFTATHPDDHPYVQSARMSLSMTLSSMGRLQEAYELEKKALAVRERTLSPDDPNLQRARMAHASTLAELGDVPAALELQRKVVEVFQRILPDGHPFTLTAEGNLANYLRQAGDLRGALAIQERLLRLQAATLPPDHPQLQRTRASLATTRLFLGDPYGAYELECKVLEVLTATLPENHPELQMARGNLATTMNCIGDWQGALALQRRVLQVFTETLPPDHSYVQRARLSLAMTLSGLEDLDGALALQREALAAYERTLPADHPDCIAARAGLAGTLSTLGDPAEALVLQEAVAKAFAAKLPADHPYVLTSRLSCACMLREVGRLDEALQQLEDLLRTYEQATPIDHDAVQLTHLNLAVTQRERGDVTAAARQLHIAATSALQGFGDHVTSSRVAPALTMQSARMLGLMAQLLDPAAALPEPEAEPLREIGLRLVVASASAELHNGELRRSVASNHPEDCERLQRQLAAATQQLDAAIALPNGPDDGQVKKRANAVREATLARDAIEREWLNLVPRELRSPPAAATLAAALTPGEVAVVFFSYPAYAGWDGRLVRDIPWRYGAFVLAADGHISWRDVAAETGIADLVVQLRQRASEPAAATEDDAGEHLLAEIGSQLFEPLRQSLPAGTRRLTVSLARDLRLIPIAALPIAADLDMQVVWSQRALLRRGADRDGPGSLLALGDVDYDASPGTAAPVVAGLGTPVLGTREPTRVGDDEAGDKGAMQRFPALANGEVQALQKLFAAAFPDGTATVLRGRDASEAALVGQARGARWLHVATHGFFATEQSWSAVQTGSAALQRFSASDDDHVAQLNPFSLTGLALAGANREPDALGHREGLLTAQEAATLDLSSCYLVTLSACESSLGVRQAGDGLASLRNAFHAAGARFVLASLWNVPDRATEQLMHDFYSRLWQHGDTPQQALRAAQEAARDRRAPLRDWAGWVLTGR
ncbi:MAG: CHAT domain-containing protein [Planctomycetes bacterium]|nr:CHAT domain-containing protein [Planctomycetota bacterium]